MLARGVENVRDSSASMVRTRPPSSTGKNVREVVLDMGLLSEIELDKIFSMENLIRPKFRGKVFAAETAAETAFATASAATPGDPR